MVLILVNKLLLTMFWLSTTIVARNCFFVIQSWVKSKTDAPKKLVISKTGLLLLALSIGFILMSLSSGITI